MINPTTSRFRKKDPPSPPPAEEAIKDVHKNDNVAIRPVPSTETINNDRNGGFLNRFLKRKNSTPKNMTSPPTKMTSKDPKPQANDTAGGEALGRINPIKMPANQVPPLQSKAAPDASAMGQQKLPQRTQAQESQVSSKAVKALAVLSRMVELLAQVRACPDTKSLSFFIVNRSREIIPYDRAVLIDLRKGSPIVLTISNVPLLSRQEPPYFLWLRDIVRFVVKKQPDKAEVLHSIDTKELPKQISREWESYQQKETKWVPLITPKNKMIGVIIIGRATPWGENDDVILSRLAETYAHAWQYLLGGAKSRQKVKPFTKWFLRILFIFSILCMLIPVRLSVLADANISPKGPLVIAAPLAGVIKAVEVKPNEIVKQGQLLFKFEDIDIRNDYSSAQKAISVTRERLRSVTQNAFTESTAKSEIRLIQVEMASQIANREYRKTLLNRVNVTTSSSGIVIFDSVNELIGKPVATGERIMIIADPSKVLIEIDLSIADNLVIKEGAEISLFLDNAPLNGYKATLLSANYTPSENSKGNQVYKLIAEFLPDQAIPRLGLKGTAKIYGEQVLLGTYLFRKPISRFRQIVGF